jgi:hypothetical protein
MAAPWAAKSASKPSPAPRRIGAANRNKAIDTHPTPLYTSLTTNTEFIAIVICAARRLVSQA